MVNHLYFIKNKNSTTNHHIVLDLDETLIHTFEDTSVIKELGIFEKREYAHVRKDIYILDVWSGPGAGKNLKYKMWGIMRPHLREFLIFCFRYFRTVSVWTAGVRSYAQAVVKKIFDHDCPNIVFAREQCSNEMGICQNKPLDKIFKEREEMNFKNTFILDDRIDNFDPNEDNGILIPRFDPSENEILETKDDAFLKLMKWLEKDEVINSKDVRNLDKTRIFK